MSDGLDVSTCHPADLAPLLMNLWRQGLKPDVREFLERAEGLTPQDLAAVLRVDQRERWQAGERVAAINYLDDYPTLRDNPETALELVYAEYLLREERGEAPTLEEYMRAYPEHAERLELQVELHRVLGAYEQDRTIEATSGTHSPRAGGGKVRDHLSAEWPDVAGYLVLCELGWGGMGIVYKARQIKLNRVVALKMIRAGERASAKQLARFQAEAEAVACLQHPNIVQIFEVGEQDGLPFIALEFVEGGNLAQKLSGKPMRAESSAPLIETLARAVHAAHLRGIVHRDLKPANVLLTADGTPKVADFDLAKRLEEGGGLSEVGFIQGTPSYMAPEQAAGQTWEIGPQTDVYALGAMLYEMLTGHPPFQGATAFEVLEQVRFSEPVAPRRLLPRLPLDLETICLKCLHKDRRRRYASAEALAEDLRHFLEGQPILARPVGRAERVWRWGLREPKVAGLLAALVLMAAVGFSLVTWQWRRAEAEADRAWTERTKAFQQRARAEMNFQRARQAVSRLTQLGEGLTELPRMDQKAREVLEESLAFYQSFLQEKSRDPGVRQEAAAACLRVGHIRHVLGQPDKSEAAYRQAADLLGQLVNESPTNTAYRRELAECHCFWGHLLRDVGKSQPALAAYQRAIVLGEQLLSEAPTNPAYQAALANVLLNRGSVLKGLKRLDEVQDDCNRAIDLQKQALATDPRSVMYREELALSLDDLADLLWTRGRSSEAEPACRRALDLRQELTDEGHLPSGFRSYLARSHWRLGRILAGTGRREDALASYRRAIVPMAGLVADSPDMVHHRNQLIETLASLAALLDVMDRRQEAEPVHRQILVHGSKLVADSPENPHYRQALANSHRRFGLSLLAADRHGDAAAEYQWIQNELPDDAPNNNGLAWILVTSPDPQLRDHARALRLAQKAVAKSPRGKVYWNTLGVAHYRNGDDPAALSALRKSMELRSGGDAFDWLFMAMAHWRLGNPAEARRWYDQSVTWIAKHEPNHRELKRFHAEAEALLTPPRP